MFFLYLVLFLIDIKLREVVSDDSFLIAYYPDNCVTQKMYDKAVDNYIASLKYIPDWFLTNKMIKKLFKALYADKNILYYNECSGDVIPNCNEMGILNMDPNNINLENNFYENYPNTIILIRFFV